MTPEQKGLRLAAAVTILSGLAFATAAWPAINTPIRLAIDLMVWPIDGTEALVTPEARLGYAISGGVITGWGVMIWMLTGTSFAQAPVEIRRMIVVSTLAWFVLDSTASVLAQVPLNLIGNSALLALFLLPILLTRRSAAPT